MPLCNFQIQAKTAKDQRIRNVHTVNTRKLCSSLQMLPTTVTLCMCSHIAIHQTFIPLIHSMRIFLFVLTSTLTCQKITSADLYSCFQHAGVARQVRRVVQVMWSCWLALVMPRMRRLLAALAASRPVSWASDRGLATAPYTADARQDAKWEQVEGERRVL